MVLTANDILGGSKAGPTALSSNQIRPSNGINQRIPFISGGLCKFSGVPDGCISLEHKLTEIVTTFPKLPVLSPSSPVSIKPDKRNVENSPDRTPKKRFIGPELPRSLNLSVSASDTISPIKRAKPEEKSDDDSPERAPKRHRFVSEELRLTFQWTGLDVAKMTKKAPGLYNNRNDCFMNAVLQFVFHTPQLIRYIQSRKTNHNCHNDSELCLYCVLNFYIDRICKRLEVFTPNKMRKIVNSLFPNRIPNNQEDAHEMLIFLLGKLEPPLPRCNGMNQTSIAPSTKPIPLTEIDKIFGGKLATRIKCRNCSYIQKKSDKFRELSLALNLNESMGLNQRVPLEHFIKSYFKAEILDDYKCDNCGRKGSISKPCIEDPPNILIIQLKRFRHNGSKNSLEIEIPMSLDLSQHKLLDSKNLKYKLYGYISHYGVTLNSGHYKATMRGYDNQWYVFDDEDVKPLNKNNNYDYRQPYLLFYYREPSNGFSSYVSPKSQLHSMFNGNSQSSTNGKRSLLSSNGHQTHFNDASSSKNGYSAFGPQFKKPKPNGYSNGYHSHNGRSSEYRSPYPNNNPFSKNRVFSQRN